MKKLLLAVLTCLSLVSYADDSSATMNQGYQEGIDASAGALKNQQLWENGQGDPRMTQGYQEGLNASGVA